jgi:DNA invertase Pin-like site-specific DNA recombinase
LVLWFIEKLSRNIGYARVSTDDQELYLQIDSLKKAGCNEGFIFTDKISGAKSSRPGLDGCLKELKPGDTLIVWRLDRLGRSMSHLVNLIESLLENDIGFKSIQDGAIDTTTASGELMFNIFSALAQFERRLIQERTKAGLDAARARGKLGGRPKKSASDPKVRMAQEMNKNKSLSIKEICDSLEISRATFYRYISLEK